MTSSWIGRLFSLVYSLVGSPLFLALLLETLGLVLKVINQYPTIIYLIVSHTQKDSREKTISYLHCAFQEYF